MLVLRYDPTPNVSRADRNRCRRRRAAPCRPCGPFPAGRRLAHGFYIAAFSRGIGFLPSRAAFAAIAAFAVVVLATVWPGISPDLKAPVVVYVGVIALMAGQAGGRAITLRDGAAAAVAAGALIFMLSDITIALMKFGNIGWPADQWTLPTYYLAQGLIAFCMLPRGRQAQGGSR